MHQQSSTGEIGFTEFVILIAFIISLVALSIDAMLPALPEIAADLGFEQANDAQFIILMLFVGMGFGQIVFGPLSDSIGRKPAINLGFVVFLVGCLMSIFAQDFNDMMIGRFLQGLGAAGPRIVSIALVRDRYAGRQMARVMSFVMTIFILIPIIAPAIGQLIINYSSWHSIFILFLVLTGVVMVWFSLRQPETLPQNKRITFSLAQMISDIKSICRIPAAIGYTITMGFVFGAFIGYLSSAQQILQTQYGLGNQFAIYFGVLAASIGLASLLNAQMVMRFGMRRLSGAAMIMTALLSVPFYLLAQYFQGHPPLAMLMAYLLFVFFFFGIMFGNLNALAMEPLGHIAGLGSAVVGSVSTLMSVVLGIIVADAYDGTVLPLVAGFAVLSIFGLITMYLTDKYTTEAVATPD
jgi:DHA1 family bicyclomycin/chloramphenicol resistance-like MFS transporter